jgi:hypothetical protein
VEQFVPHIEPKYLCVRSPFWASPIIISSSSSAAALCQMSCPSSHRSPFLCAKANSSDEMASLPIRRLSYPPSPPTSPLLLLLHLTPGPPHLQFYTSKHQRPPPNAQESHRHTPQSRLPILHARRVCFSPTPSAAFPSLRYRHALLHVSACAASQGGSASPVVHALSRRNSRSKARRDRNVCSDYRPNSLFFSIPFPQRKPALLTPCPPLPHQARCCRPLSQSVRTSSDQHRGASV